MSQHSGCHFPGTPLNHNNENTNSETANRSEQTNKHARQPTAYCNSLVADINNAPCTTHSYKKNPNGPVGNELDLKEGDTLVYLMEHDDNDSWWLAEDVKGQVGYVPAAYLMIILDEFLHEKESRKEAHEKRTDGTKIGGEIWDWMEKEEILIRRQ